LMCTSSAGAVAGVGIASRTRRKQHIGKGVAARDRRTDRNVILAKSIAPEAAAIALQIANTVLPGSSDSAEGDSQHVDPGDRDRVVFQFAGDLDDVAGVLGEPRKILIGDRNALDAVLGGQHVLVPLPRAFQRALPHVDFTAVIAAALAVADHAGPVL